MRTWSMLISLLQDAHSPILDARFARSCAAVAPPLPLMPTVDGALLRPLAACLHAGILRLDTLHPNHRLELFELLATQPPSGLPAHLKAALKGLCIFATWAEGELISMAPLQSQSGEHRSRCDHGYS